MSQLIRRVELFSIFLWLTLLSNWGGASSVSERLLPAETKGFLSIADLSELEDLWAKTQLGQLANDPVMKPFADDMRRQIQRRLETARLQLGLKWEDLKSISSGEVALALTQPVAEEPSFAIVLVVDTSDRDDELSELLARVDASMTDQNATKSSHSVNDVAITSYSIPSGKPDFPDRVTYQFVHGDRLVVSDHKETAEGILARLDSLDGSCLAETDAFQSIMGKCHSAVEEMRPNIRWFLEPIGYVRATRALQAARGVRTRRGKDYLKTLASQGFDAVQGIGGHINLATNEHEILHRTFFYAPASNEEEKYELAFRMFDFPNIDGLSAPWWVPSDIATYMTFRWKMQAAFEYSATLVDAIAEDEGFFENVLLSIKEDEYGPRIDIREELVKFLGESVTVVTDHEVPVTTNSEQVVFALEITNAEKVAASINRALDGDPMARKSEYMDHVIWEIVEEEEPDLAAVTIQGIAFSPVPQVEPEVEQEQDRLLANTSICVVKGHVMVASKPDLLKRIITKTALDPSLKDDDDFKMVNLALDALGGGEDSFRMFSRTDKEYRTPYELIRQGKMPEAQTLMGKLLNRLLGPPEPDLLREQKIDGTNLPDYNFVRDHLGPAGMYVRSLDDGWIMLGVLLRADPNAIQMRDRRPAISTATVPDDTDVN